MSAEALPQQPVGRDLVFVSYSRDDAEWMQAFRVMLEPVLDGLRVRLWVDTDIRPGDEWNTEIERAIARSLVALVLVSPRFLASSYIRRHELPALLAHGVRLAPILVGSCLYQQARELTRVQWLHDPGREGPLNLAEQIGERDRRITQACTKLIDLLPRPVAPVEAEIPTGRRDGIPVESAPSASEPGPLSAVPALPPGYVPRDELAELITAIVATESGAAGVTGRRRSFGLHGQGGIGKSVLAAAVARDESVRRRFPDGVFWVTVGETGMTLTAQLDLLRRLDPSVPAPRTPAEVQRSLRQGLATRRVLLVVDDVWSDAAARAFQLTGPRGRVLFTTRDPRVLDAVAARVVPVDVLSLPAARSLAAAVLNAGGSDDADHGGLSAAADLAFDQVGRVALAVALLAAAVRGGRTWTQVADDLVGDADVFGDHPYANTFKAMQIGLTTLPAKLRDALHGLAVFPRDARIPVAAVAQYWAYTRDASTADTTANLERLAAANVLTLSPTGVEFHDLQHDYLLLHAPALADLHAQLLDAFRDLLLQRNQWWQLPPEEPYLRDHLITHLRGAGARRELAATITDPAFLVQRIAAGGVLVAERDLAEAARTLPAHSDIAWWRSWLPQHTHVLDLPDLFAGLSQRVRALAPTLRAWLAADPSLPAGVEAHRLLACGPRAYLDVCWGLAPPPSAQTRVLSGHVGMVHAVAWSPDGTHLAAGGADEAVRIWDLTTGQVSASLAGHTGYSLRVYTLGWSPDGTRLASGGPDNTVRIWDPITGKADITLTGHTDTVHALAWSPSGTQLATAGFDTVVRIWDSTTWQHTTTLTGHTGWVYTLAWSPDGTRLATAGRDRTVRFWDPTTGRPTTAFSTFDARAGDSKDAGTVMALAWSPDGTSIATTISHDMSKIWDSTTGEPITTHDGHPSAGALAWSSDGTRLATTGGGEVQIWDPGTGTTIKTLTGHIGMVTAAAWSPDGTQLATAGYDTVVRLWDPTIANIAPTSRTSPVDKLAWSPDGTQLATTGGGGEVQIRDPTNGTATTTLTGHVGRLTAVAWSPDGTQLAAGGETPLVQIWNATTGQPTTTFIATTWKNGKVNKLAWPPDGTRLATSIRHELEVRIWNPGTGQLDKTLAVHVHGVELLAWSPDGTRLAAGHADGMVRIFDVETWDVVIKFRTAQLIASLSALSWSPDRTYIATTHPDGTVRIRQVRASRLRRWFRPLRTHGPVLFETAGPDRSTSSPMPRPAIAWSHRTGQLAAGGSDGTVTILDPATGEVHGRFLGSSSVTMMTTSPDGDYLAVLRSNNEVAVYATDKPGEASRLQLGTTSGLAWSGDRIAAYGPAGITILRWAHETSLERPFQ